MSGGLNTLDLVLLVLFSLSVLLGVFRGFVRELLSLAFFVIAVVTAFWFYRDVGKLFNVHVKSRDVSNFAGFVVIFVVVIILGTLLTYLIRKLLTMGPLRTVDKILGAVFGLVRGILVAAIIIFVLAAFRVDEQLVRESRFSPFVVKAAGVFIHMLPGGHYKTQLQSITHTTEKTTADQTIDQTKNKTRNKTKNKAIIAPKTIEHTKTNGTENHDGQTNT